MPTEVKVHLSSDLNGLPLCGVEVEAINVDSMLTDSTRPIDTVKWVTQVATTDETGTATFSLASPSSHYYKPRYAAGRVRVEVLSGGGGAGGDSCWDAVVKPDGTGTDATLTAALARLSETGGKILICGMLNEQVVIPSRVLGDVPWLLAGRHPDLDGIAPTTASSVALTVGTSATGVNHVILQRLHLGGVGDGTSIGIKQVGVLTGFIINGCKVRSSSGPSLNKGVEAPLSAWANTCIITDSEIVGNALGLGVVPIGEVLLDNCYIEGGSAGNAMHTTASGILGFVVVNCQFKAGGNVIHFGSATQLTLSNCLIECTSATGHCIHMGSSLGLSTFSGLVFRRTVTATTGNALNLDGAGVNRVVLQGLVFRGSHQHAIYVDSPIQQLVISNCVIGSSPTISHAIYLAQILNNPSQKVSITGCAIEGAGGDGIRCKGTNTNGFDNARFRNLTITGNVIYGCTGDGINFQAYAFGYHHIAISGNDISDNGGWGINDVGANTDNVSVVGNSISGNVAGQINNIVDNGGTIRVGFNAT